MRKIKDLSEGTFRFVFIAIALYCLTLSLISFVNVMVLQRQTVDGCLWIDERDGVKPDSGTFIVEITPGGVADEAGLKDGDLLIAINNKGFIQSYGAQDILNTYSNELVEYTVIRNGEIIKTNIWVYKFFNVLYLIFWALGFGFLLVAVLVGYSKPKEFTSQLFFFLGCSASVGLITLSGSYISINYFFLVNYIFFSLLFHPLFVHFFLTYPVKYEFRYRKQIILFSYLILFAIPIAQIVLNFVTKVEYPILPDYYGLIILSIYIICGFLAFTISYRRIKEKALKKSLGIIMMGFLIGFSGFLYYFTFQIVTQKPLFLINPLFIIPTILVLAIPISFGISIFKYRILDTEFIIKRGLVFGIVTALIVGFYLLIVFLINSFLSGYFQENRQVVTIAFIVLVTFTFDFVNKKAKEFVDKHFYRERYNYRKSLLQFSEELSYISNINEILEKIGSSIKDTMGMKKVNIWIKNDEYYNLLKKESFVEIHKANPKYHEYKKEKFDSLFDKAMLKIFEHRKAPIQLSELNLSEMNLSTYEKSIIKESEVTLAIPIYLKAKLIGALVFGQKPSGKAYSEEDIDLLKTLASQSAIAFENSRLQKEEIDKQKIEEELNIAKKIQDDLLPKEDFKIEGLEISGLSIPAKSIGGDFYDLIKISDDKILVVVADVSGKGIPAALYMSKVQAVIQFASTIFRSPRDILIEVNKEIHEQLDKNSFITMVIALFDLSKMKVTISRAGHNPVIYSQNGQLKTLQSKGMGLGLEDENIFDENLEETELNINSDNIFLLYSDGLTEAMNHVKEEFGTERVLSILKDNKDQSVRAVQEKIINSVNNFRQNSEQNDDITFVVVKVK